ncbi:MAG: hypothetical protein ACTTJ9_04225 [Segatella oris]|uniref:hypothetical protein n=1 Tax=Segatella oris TaxID=28135 RepID=UPI003FA1C537
MPKTAFRLRATSGKREKQPVARAFSSKIAKNSVSLAATSEKREKSCFGASRKIEIQKNSVSGCPDELFFVKMNRRGVPKPQNFEK